MSINGSRCNILHMCHHLLDTHSRLDWGGGVDSLAQHPPNRWADVMAWTCEHGQRVVCSGGLVVEVEAGFTKEV